MAPKTTNNSEKENKSVATPVTPEEQERIPVENKPVAVENEDNKPVPEGGQAPQESCCNSRLTHEYDRDCLDELDGKLIEVGVRTADDILNRRPITKDTVDALNALCLIYQTMRANQHLIDFGLRKKLPPESEVLAEETNI